ncbi:L-threonine 3-dehydrogenase [Priestia megaterium]|jgi:nucleoside-diphosphate-sugar epimerase|uniref:3-beta hydroxysteroid dehydrogenase/isomerase family protein n=1 Tax=Priestia megaterium (strain ATCC 14581 / DSM 32 / CCUG 1817 / JCM 2506 / NBRC 15308 / NCIMB 9376 / NCTC 10342 / NRRL B-14308 / VKM B-512 / Ford 19) TaxID=1348623 RepID=A0A0B6A6U8_PRIM2|nr:MULTISPECIES: L-threonine 3-dehydrogenase [Priestia]AJI20675.1 3-beta hydroxysteroid dehydrogenase/isomerase family protein [Priestia megaterium NBRC 15308 = ATCC 14581]AYE52017.1 L-threonine 3-dehydrogenase [Priestia megaterium NCT-2]KFM95994.1 3-beta hydroxysteroid dehydrogenase/isomerase family protein [Priestia megaterium]KGJ84994.1 UDP-glucose 4-epimerase [Priestia megaterium NBRC 15308 = ATCC 14581]KNH24167.1 UDP-glucose 4-epimerase [Priestia megaterium]
MKKVLITGSLGQIGSELTTKMREIYGSENIIATDIRKTTSDVVTSGPFEILDVTDQTALFTIAKKHKVDTIIHLAALLSATAEQKPLLAWNLNMGGLVNALEVARELQCQFFTPSSIGAFGPTTPKDWTPQDTIQRPTTMYGVNKVAGELLCDYYHHKFGVDTRGLRFPGLISYVTPPGGGTTDYAVEIYYEAVKHKRYTSYIDKGTYMDMMYMPDALNAVIQLMEADGSKLKHRNSFNVSAMSFDPEQMATEIRKTIPEFVLNYQVDPVRQAIAESWPNHIDSSCAIEEWGFKTEYNLEKMTREMLGKLKVESQLVLT